MENFTKPLLEWFDINGRKHLPWQHPRSPYRVWISEIMLQQTQVQTVIPYFLRFIDCFPDVETLAEASEDAVFSVWAGLGYYSRARNLHRSAKIIVENFNGIIPGTPTELISLPGIGESTAAAIASQAFDIPAPILDANVKRVLARYFMVEGHTEKQSVKNILWGFAGDCMSDTRPADYTQAIMDLGALICKSSNPGCNICPVNQTCLAYKNNLTKKFPERKPKKPKPERELQFLLLYNDDQSIYLEKRPSTGIWNSLWSLPDLELHHTASEFIEKNYAMQAKRIENLPSFKHSFTHYHLNLHPFAIHINPLKNRVCESRGQWFSKTEVLKLGLPKPIKTIIMNWFAQNL